MRLKINFFRELIQEHLENMRVKKKKREEMTEEEVHNDFINIDRIFLALV